MANTKVPSELVSDQVFGRRNLFINGKMQIAARAATASQSTSAYVLDRWLFTVQAAGTYTVSQSTDVPTGQGFAYSQKIDCTTADASIGASDYLLLQQKIEGINVQHLKFGTSSAESLTLSFWVKSNKTGTYIAEFVNNNSGGAALVSQSYTISSANTWEKKTITIDGDTSLALQNTTDAELVVYIWLAAGSNYTGGGSLNSSGWNSSYVTNTRVVGQVNFADSTSNDFYITGMQLEAGDNATPFEHISYAEELRDCERYYQELPVQDRTFVQYSTTNYAYGGNINYWRPMRTTPTVTNGGNGEVYPNGGNKLTSSGLVSLQNPTYNRSQANVYHTTLSNSYTGYFVRSDNIKLDAEL
tara:strand:+ start:68 stop:1141 length:1074 start_codon:yes stop_codon:yes gene_type:complete